MYSELPITVKDPLWVTGNYNQNIQAYNSLGFTINADGGYDRANITIPVTRIEAEDWYMNGLGRDITIHNPNLVVRFEGFINKIRINIGTLSVERGPIMDIANKVSLVFSTIDTSTDPPILGVRETTATSSDTDSQTLYGIIEKTLSTGGAVAATAEQIRDTYLEEYKDPQVSQNITIGGQGQPGSMTLEILGYVHWFSLYPYNSTTTGTRTYTLRLQDVINADPNGIFSTDFNLIDTNASTVPRYDNDNRKAWAVIKDVVSKGDTSYNRYTFGIYANRRATYTVMPNEISYYHKISDPKQRIEGPSGNEVKVYDILPARWMQVSDWLVGRSGRIANIKEDQRNIFIESIVFTSPDSLQIRGGKTNTMPQILGKLGLSGIGA